MTSNIKKALVIILGLYALHGCSQPVMNTQARAAITLESRDTIIQSAAFDFQFIATQLPSPRIQSIINTTLDQRQEIINFIGSSSPNKAVIKIFTSIEEKSLATRDGRLSKLYFDDQQIHLVCNNYFDGAHELAQNRWVIRNIQNTPKTSCLENGLAATFAPNWLSKGYQHHAKMLAQSQNLPPLSEIIDNDFFEKESPILMNICAAAFVDFLIQHWGKSKFLQQYNSWVPTSDEVTTLNQKWTTYILNNYKSKKVIPVVLDKSFHGFNFAHEGYKIYNGYGSKLAKTSLDTLTTIGANAIAIVPYTFMRDHRVATFLPFIDHAGYETDETVALTHLHAKEKNMTTLLKPQIWVRNSWPGDIAMKSEAEWDLFFDYYYRWVRHYALLAEIYQMDIFCIGVELSKATLSYPNKWKDMIQKIKGIYSGPITYAANWGEEFERLQFAASLDYLSINCYYPLSDKNRPNKEKLIAGFKKIVQKVEQKSIQTGKRVLFTEIGFRSIAAPWIQPHESHKGQAISEEDQATCYQIVLEELENHSWCAGLFWWKWPCYLSYMGDDNSGFSPNRKLAEKVFKQFHQ